MKMRRKGNGPASEDAVVLDEVQESEAPEKVLAGVLAVTAEETAEGGSSSSGVSENGAGTDVAAAAAPGAGSGSGASGTPRPRQGNARAAPGQARAGHRRTDRDRVVDAVDVGQAPG